MTEQQRIFRGPVTLDHDHVEDAIALTVYNPDNTTVDARILIPTHRVGEFMRSVASIGVTVIESSVGRIATGYCATCSNLGTVSEPAEDEERRARIVRCPDCSSRRVTGREAFAVAPSPIGRGRPS